MAPLRNQRHEAFCLALFENKSATEAYVLAGFKPSRQNAARLTTKDDIRARVAELQAQAAVDSKVTVESICRELDEANMVAKAKGQAAAMVSAATLRAKLAGLMVERVEVGQPGDFEGCEGYSDIADRMIADLIERFKPVDEQDRQGLIQLIERHCQEMSEYVDAIKARPITAERVDARRLDTPWQQLRPHSAPTRLPTRTNGASAK